MGRRAKAPASPTTRNHGMLGWGAFLAVLLGFSAPRLGMSANAGIALAGTCLVVFFLVWYLGSAGTKRP
ncbi:hypothetical protein ACSYDW_14380 [Paeniglutamicibacter sp. R2-26]|uniref:hypothetical protein n=1 Tax=Paeniglutamicibacter sp. R2-26 TaxID=3144417 RepID=UPI003EE7BD31